MASLKKEFDSHNTPFIYTTQAWLISLYLECPPNAGLHCPDNTGKQALIDSINTGALIWHAFPFNSQMEMYDPSLVEYGLWLAMKYVPSIIPNYNGLNGSIPRVLSQRDIPGMTRSLIPIFTQNNVSAISIGCNGASAPPGTPNIFMWKDPDSNEQIITMLHKGGYGGTKVSDAVMINGYDTAIIFYWDSDNKGPYNYTQYVNELKNLQKEFPNAYVHISSFDAYVNNLPQSIIDKLPVISSEMGDTWQHGSASDPLKLGKFRIAENFRSECTECSYVNSYAFSNFSRFLLKNGEHTFGVSEKRFNNSIDAWSNPELKKAMNNKDIKEFLYSWNEQRWFGLDYAMEALSMAATGSAELKLYNDILNEFNVLDNVETPDLSNYNKLSDNSVLFNVEINNKPYIIQFNSSTGALNELINNMTGIKYIEHDSTTFPYGLGLFYYSTRTENDFSEWFIHQYDYHPNKNVCNKPNGFCKSGLSKAAPFVIHQNVLPKLINLYQHKNDKNVFLAEMNFGSKQNDLQTNYGIPEKLYNIVNFTNNNDAKKDSFSMELIWINKTFTRIPESIFMAFNPNIACDNMYALKVGEIVNINDVMVNGTWHMHTVDANYGYVECEFNNKQNSIYFVPIEAGVASFVPIKMNEYTSFPIPMTETSDLKKGVAFILFDNTWNTNFPFWYPFSSKDNNAMYRFNVLLS
eukprot:54231_1